MSFLKRLPFAYKAIIDKIRVINFTVDMDEIRPLVPEGIQVSSFNGRALISLADLRVKQMRPVFLPSWLSFSYRHIAFRLLIEDEHAGSEHQSIYFLRSFADKPLVAFTGNLMSHYQFAHAEIKRESDFNLTTGQYNLSYRLNDHLSVPPDEWKSRVEVINRAFALDAGKRVATWINPQVWPLKPVGCEYFSTSFFPSARLEGAYYVPQSLDFYRSVPAIGASPGYNYH